MNTKIAKATHVNFDTKLTTYIISILYNLIPTKERGTDRDDAMKQFIEKAGGILDKLKKPHEAK